MNEINVGDKVICKPVLSGIEDLAGKQGVVTRKLNKGFYVNFGKKKEVLVAGIELELCNER